MSRGTRVEHLPIETIWEFAKYQTKLSATEFSHLTNCDECVGILGLCKMFDSIARVQQHLNERRLGRRKSATG